MESQGKRFRKGRRGSSRRPRPRWWGSRERWTRQRERPLRRCRPIGHSRCIGISSVGSVWYQVVRKVTDPFIHHDTALRLSEEKKRANHEKVRRCSISSGVRMLAASIALTDYSRNAPGKDGCQGFENLSAH